ncbi:UDP-glucose/GDP-mannose dehydrogenase family protein [archaeon]|jgi:UDPglucose 6-dehydrogenase|nr:UDP-glucose/GDP-mannose dehydrogenase family protein [archaeon]MBT6697541.1 UDP-glucose/GDP-mannose dehydrogenase family protein [archaeon]
MKIAIFGTGYVGLVTGACLANLGHHVTCVDIDENKINSIKQGIIPFYEPGLPKLVKNNIQKKRLQFTTDAKTAINEAQAIFNCVGTPGKEDGSANLEYVFQVTKTVAVHTPSDQFKILINKSTVPPGTAKSCQKLIKETNPSSQVQILSNPEFLKEGAAVHDFTHPDRIVVGTNQTTTKNNELIEKAKSLIRKIYLGRSRLYIPFIETSWETSEIIKYASNAFLATKISFINEVANIADIANADIKVIAQAMGMDYRISSKFLGAGVGYGGSCFPKDVRALANTAKQFGYTANLLTQVDLTNKAQKDVLPNKILNYFQNKIENKTITVLGLSFKPKTSDMREAPSTHIIKKLIQNGAKIKAYDPIAIEEAKHLFTENELQSITFTQSQKDATTNTEAIALITEWDEFRTLDFESLKIEAPNCHVIFDGRNIYEPDQVIEAGFDYVGIGRQ